MSHRSGAGAQRENRREHACITDVSWRIFSEAPRAKSEPREVLTRREANQTFSTIGARSAQSTSCTLRRLGPEPTLKWSSFIRDLPASTLPLQLKNLGGALVRGTRDGWPESARGHSQTRKLQRLFRRANCVDSPVRYVVRRRLLVIQREGGVIRARVVSGIGHAPVGGAARASSHWESTPSLRGSVPPL